MEEIKKIEVSGQQYGVADMLMRSVMGGNAQVIEWSHTHNMNDYKDAGTYRIKGERTGNPLSDNLPIMNSGSGHTIEGVLYVLDSSLPNGSGNSDDCTITQFLMLSNRVGGQEGDMYMRSAYGANKDNLTWKPWEKFQTNMEVGVVSDDATHDPSNFAPINTNGLNSLVDNGIYSGVYLTQEALSGDSTKAQTFVMVAINNYAVAGDNKTITQIKFAVTNAGEYSMERRRRGFDGKWSGWINEYNDLYTQIDKIEKEIVTKQQELTLTVLDNGNIRIGNLQGQTKDFMPATPSGDPMHYAYITAGALYNDTDKPISRLAPWKTNELWEMNADGTHTYWEEDAYVQHLPGHWYLSGIGDLSNTDMRTILIDLTGFYNCAYYFSNSRVIKRRGINPSYHINGSCSATFSSTKTAVIDIDYLYFINADLAGFFSDSRLLEFVNAINVYISNCTVRNMFRMCEKLKQIKLSRTSVSLDLAYSPLIYKRSILHLINECTPTTAITITLHPDAYVRIANQPDIIEALETNNANLASKGGSISLVSA